MTGKSPFSATEEQHAGLMVLAGSRDPGKADRARAVLLTLAGWISPKIAEAFGGRRRHGAAAAQCLYERRHRCTEGQRRTRVGSGEQRGGLAHQTFVDTDEPDQANHQAVGALNTERMALPLARPRIAA